MKGTLVIYCTGIPPREVWGWQIQAGNGKAICQGARMYRSLEAARRAVNRFLELDYTIEVRP